MRITEAAGRLGTSPRMLRYRESLGLLPAVRGPAARHRQFGDADLDAVGLGLEIERRFDVSPAALAFGLRVLTDPVVRAQVADLGRRIGRIQPPPARAIDFEKERALRLLGLPAGRGQDRPRARRPGLAAGEASGLAAGEASGPAASEAPGPPVKPRPAPPVKPPAGAARDRSSESGTLFRDYRAKESQTWSVTASLGALAAADSADRRAPDRQQR
jgi:hypothetical protein